MVMEPVALSPLHTILPPTAAPSALPLGVDVACQLTMTGAQQAPLSQEQIQQQLERLKQLRQSGEQQGSQGAEQMESLLVRHSHLQEAGRGQCQAGL